MTRFIKVHWKGVVELNRKITKRNSDEKTSEGMLPYPRENNAQQIYDEGIKIK